MNLFSTRALLQKLGGLLFCAVFSLQAQAQQTLTLEQSIELARQHNVALRQAQHNSSKASVNLRRTQFAYLPTITARADASRINGLTFDNVSGQVRRGNTTTSNPYIAGQLVLFDGFSRYFELKKAAAQAQAGKYTQAQAEIEMEAAVTGYYLQAILDRENINISKDRIALLQSQVQKMEKLEKAGTRTEQDVYQLKSQLATEQLNLITNENSYRATVQALAQQINAGPDANYELQAPTTTLDITAPLPPLDSVMARALANSPQLKAAKANLGATKQSMKIARSGISPTLSLDGIIGSNYSNNIQELNTETNTYQNIPYFEQLDQNQQKIVQLSLSIPVFRGLSSHFETQTARLDLRNAELDYIAAQNQLQQTVQNAYQDVLAAREKYATAQANIEYANKAFEAAKRRYEAGTIDLFSYMESLNNKNKVQTELLQSTCEFYFKHRILELYQG